MSKQKMTPSEAFVETLVSEGVKYAFGIVGSAYEDPLDLFPAAGIRFRERLQTVVAGIISVAQAQGAKIRAKAIYAEEGEKSTKYFLNNISFYKLTFKFYSLMIGTLRESSLHATLKQIYKEPGDKIEKSVDKYVIDIEDEIDLAIIVFPSSVCHLALEQCGKKGIKSTIIISAGFKEVGGNGIEREKQIIDIAHKHGMSFIGPNCLGVINTDPKSLLNASFARKMPAAVSTA